MIKIITRRSVLEQAIARKDFDRRVENLGDTVIKHLAKIILHKDDINQNKWRKEVADKFDYLNGSMGKNGKKFSRAGLDGGIIMKRLYLDILKG